MHTRSFRPVRTTERRAIFSQLVALDTELAPHVTPIVGRIEFRNGFEHDASACAVKLDAKRLHCKSSLKPVQAMGLQPNMFLRFEAAGRVNCLECHGADSGQKDGSFFGDLDPLGPGDVEAHLAQRATALAKQVGKLGDRVRELTNKSE